MDERMRRQWAASEATAYGWGGIQAVAQATGLSPTTIRKDQAELAARAAQPKMAVTVRLRRPGGGRKCKTDEYPELVEALEKLVDPVTRGDPESPLRWTCKSTATLASELRAQGHMVSDSTVGRLLKSAGYSLQSNRKTREGASHLDRNAQFEHINLTVCSFQNRDQPVISVNTKKKELIGDFKNSGREWQPKG
jgi:transposase